MLLLQPYTKEGLVILESEGQNLLEIAKIA